MTLQEFKAWFEGFTESMDKTPTAKQWERIQKRVKEIDGTATSYPVFVDRYYREYRPYWSPLWYNGGVSMSQSIGGTAGLQAVCQNAAQQVNVTDTISLSANFTDAGRAEYNSMQ